MENYVLVDQSSGISTSLMLTAEEASRCSTDYGFLNTMIRERETGQQQTNAAENFNMGQNSNVLSEELGQQTNNNDNVNMGQHSNLLSEETDPQQTVAGENFNMEQNNNLLSEYTGQQTNNNGQNSNVLSEEMGTIFRWGNSNVLLLLTTYEELQHKFCDNKLSQKKAYQLVADSLNKKFNYPVTGSQCRSKIQSLLKIYKGIKDHNNKSGNDRKSWKFYDRMDAIFGSKAWATPVCVLSELPQNTGAAEEESRIDPEHRRRTLSSRNSKSSIVDLLKERVEQKERHEAARQARHEERMKHDKEIINLLADFLKK